MAQLRRRARREYYPPPSNGLNGWWRYVAIAALSILIGMASQIFREPKDIVTKEELTLQLEQVKSQNLGLQAKLDAQTRETVALRATVNQMSIDIAGIAVKVGAPAHPVVAPAN